MNDETFRSRLCRELGAKETSSYQEMKNLMQETDCAWNNLRQTFEAKLGQSEEAEALAESLADLSKLSQLVARLEERSRNQAREIAHLEERIELLTHSRASRAYPLPGATSPSAQSASPLSPPARQSARPLTGSKSKGRAKAEAAK